MTVDPAPLPALTGVRALAAGWVLLYHLRPWMGPLPGPLANLVDAGFLGVDLFFALSGYVLAHNYLSAERRPRGRAMIDFWWLRLARIYPVHLVVTAGVMVLAALHGASSDAHHGGRALVEHLGLVHAWHGDAVTTWNIPSWSISAEWAAYLCFPAIAAIAVRVRDGRVAVAAAAGALAASAAALAWWRPGVLDVNAGAALMRIAGPFVAGVLLARAAALGTGAGLRWDRAATALGIALLAVGTTVGPTRALVVLSAAWVAALARAPGHRGLARALSRRSMVAAGERSYAFYLVHGPILLVVAGASSSTSGTTAALAITAWSVLAAILLHRHVEEPARRWLRSALVHGRQTAAASTRGRAMEVRP